MNRDNWSWLWKINYGGDYSPLEQY
jgi:hypothetical protein